MLFERICGPRFGPVIPTAPVETRSLEVGSWESRISNAKIGCRSLPRAGRATHGGHVLPFRCDKFGSTAYNSALKDLRDNNLDISHPIFGAVIEPRSSSWITKVRASSWRTWHNTKRSHHHRGDHDPLYCTMHTNILHGCFAPNCRF